MTSQDAARVFGIGVTTLLRMEGTVFPTAPRRGSGSCVFFPLRSLRWYVAEIDRIVDCGRDWNRAVELLLEVEIAARDKRR